MAATIDGRAIARVAVRSTSIAVRELPVLADIGVNPEEIGRRQTLIVSVTLAVDRVAADRIDATIDYRRIARAAEMLGEQRIGLIETYAERLAGLCLAMDGVRRARVKIDKPQALPAGIASVVVVAEHAIEKARTDAHRPYVLEEE